jgi:hypothetical protein
VGRISISHTLLRAIQAMIIGALAGIMFLIAIVLAAFEKVFTKRL